MDRTLEYRSEPNGSNLGQRGANTTCEGTSDPTFAEGRSEIETHTVHSGAGHDTMQVAEVTDAGLLFIASENGRSHSPRERADWNDCTAATTVLAESLCRLATTDHPTRQ